MRGHPREGRGGASAKTQVCASEVVVYVYAMLRRAHESIEEPVSINASLRGLVGLGATATAGDVVGRPWLRRANRKAARR